MRNRIEALEQVIRENWKELIPVYGVYQIEKDQAENRRTIMGQEDDASLLRYLIVGLYHSLIPGVAGVAVAPLIYHLVDALLE